VVVLYPDQLPETERARLFAMLAEPPIAAEPDGPSSTWLVALLGGDLYLGYLQLTREWPSGTGWGAPLLLSVVLGVAVAAIALLFLAMRARSRVAAASYRCG
jgi:hypothetical protein